MNHPPVKQEEITGCGIASVANILGKSYVEIKTMANAMGIYAEDESLWSDTTYVRKLLAQFNVVTVEHEQSFKSWEDLPSLALLAIKHHQVNGKNFWHWVVYKRSTSGPFVIDSAQYLSSNIRTDFEHMHPKWFIEVILPN